jgi:hypothetical protein
MNTQAWALTMGHVAAGVTDGLGAQFNFQNEKTGV